MIHQRRVFRLTPAASPSQLVDELVDRSQTRCTAFSYGDLVFANDAFSEDGAQEYAVVRGDRQIDSITFSWIENRAHTVAYIEKLLAGAPGVDMGAVALRTNHPAASNSCPLCD